MSVTTTMLEAARELLAFGLRPIPARGKVPLVEWKDYQTEAPHPDQLDVWWAERWPDANVGVVTGGGLVVVDLDGEGAEGLLHNVNVVLPRDAPRARTGHGEHVYLAVDEPVDDRIALLTAPGGKKPQVDVRGLGFVVTPPSLHPSGRRYEWVVPLRHPLPKAPDALIRLIRAPRLAAQNGGSLQDWAKLLAGVPLGARHATLTQIAGHYLGLDIPKHEVKAILYGFADRCTPPHPHADVDTVVDDLAAKDAAKAQSEHSRAPVLVRLSDIAPEPVEWLWKDRIARGKLALVIGEPGEGKSTSVRDLSARVTRGAEWPDGGRAPRGTVVILSAEDGIADTERPRMDRQGGDVSGVYLLRGTRDEQGEYPFNLERDLPALEQALATTGAVLLVIDPLSAYLGSKDSYKDAEIRGILTPLVALAERYRVAVVGILHLTKAAQRRLLLRAQGSVAFVAQARTVLAVGRDPEVPGRRLLAAIKNNLGPEPPTLAFGITERGLEWGAVPVEGNAERLLASDEAATRTESREREVAATFLRDLLGDGPIASKQVEADAKANGIAQRTLWRAKTDLGIIAARASAQNGRPAAWYWQLPVEPAP